MRCVILAVAVFAALAAAQTAQGTGCAVMADSNPFRPSTCPGYVSCASTMCGCVGVPSGTSALTCGANTTVSCPVYAKCLVSYIGCLNGLTFVRLNASDPCNSWAVNLYAQQLTAAASMYSGSALQASCLAYACALTNASSIAFSTCTTDDFGAAGIKVCPAFLPMNATTTVAPETTAVSTTEAPIVLVVSFTLKIKGTFTTILLNVTAKALLQVALRNDIAKYLKILAKFVIISNMVDGSLVVTAGIQEGSGILASVLLSNINAAAGSSAWLTEVQAAYTAAGGVGTLTVDSITAAIVTTPSPTKAPGTSSASSISAALVAVAALFALAF